MKRDARPALHDILRSIGWIETDTRGLTKDAFNDDRRVRQLVERNIEIISEASRSLPASLKQRYPEIEWKDVAGIGSILRHDYDGVEADILWDVVRRDLAPLKRVVRRMLKALESQ